MRRLSKYFALMLGCLILVSVSTNAQNQIISTELHLIVADTQNNLVSGAQCILRKGEKIVAQTQTNKEGIVIFQNLEGGLYQLSVEKDGFEKYQTENLEIGANFPRERAVSLEISKVSAQVNVENSAENVQSVEAGSSPPVANVQRKTIERLPLATKRVDEAIPLVPGVI
ncbi:MAG: carboxypeptidase-like regulatory domain-containing protein, partial [Actinomycetota bacterium]